MRTPLVALASLLVQSSSVSWAQQASWNQVQASFGGAAFQGRPFSQPCYEDWDSSDCAAVRSSYTQATLRSNSTGAYVQTQWETCQTSGEQCLLDYTNPSNRDAVNSKACSQGSVPSYFIDVQDYTQVQEALAFSRSSGTPLTIKNTGHDYKGRSSAPESLALWTHNLKNISLHGEFVPEGCSMRGTHRAVTMGAGVQFSQLYAFAHENNVTVIGGSDSSVGASGGWLQGGGHSALSNTLGMGVDRVLQFKVVTPDGHYRVANACQNKDLFFALRGGGGGTFGVVLESTVLATPKVTLQATFFSFKGNITHTQQLWSAMIDNGLKWADEGWGGYSNSGAFIFITPKLKHDEAVKSMAPMAALAEKFKSEGVANVSMTVTEYDSWLDFYSVFASVYKAVTGVNLAMSSRLINKDSFRAPKSKEALLKGLVDTYTMTPGLIILATTPASYKGDGTTSVTEAWRDSLYHITAVSPWNWNATKEEKEGAYSLVTRSMDNLRRITPDAAYSNECDVYEPNHQVSFWGKNYEKLLAIKQKYDPHHLLDCWQCVGWNPSSPRYQCYLPQPQH